jgi:Flp pilus assembly protein TadG
MTRAIRAGFRDEGGQSIVEFALIMPFLVLLLLAITQFGLAFHNYLAITDAARVGARKAAVSLSTGNPCPPARTAIQNTVSATQWGVISQGSRVSCTPGAKAGDDVTIQIQYPISIGLPQIFGLPRIAVSGTMTTQATERLE